MNMSSRTMIGAGAAIVALVRTMIAGVGSEPDKENVPEGVATDVRGNVYGAEVALKNVTRYVRADR